jgi:hypothetical protein
MIVASEVPFSLSWVIAQCRRSWNRNPGRPAFFVSVLQAVRQLFTCRVGSVRGITLSPAAVLDVRIVTAFTLTTQSLSVILGFWPTLFLIFF